MDYFENDKDKNKPVINYKNDYKYDELILNKGDIRKFRFNF